MALRIGQSQSASYPAVLPTDEEGLTTEPEAAIEEAVQEPLVEEAPIESGSVVEWLQEAIDICKSYECPEELSYALEQALALLIGPSAVGATETAPVEEVEPEPAPEEVEEVE